MSRPVLSNAGDGARLARLDRDRGLVEAARCDPARFDALYRKYLAQVYSFAYYELRDHHTAEDATERVFMKALAGLPRFEERGGDFITPASATSEGAAADASTFRVWLFQIARKPLGIENGALAVGILCLAIALFSLSRLQETFHKDLDYFEEYL